MYDYAISGAPVERETLRGEEHRGFVEQVMEDFIPFAGNRSVSQPWSPANSVFGINPQVTCWFIVIWIGINNVVWVPNLERAIAMLFKTVEQLYAHDAREFVFVNVPPLERTPAGMLGYLNVANLRLQAATKNLDHE